MIDSDYLGKLVSRIPGHGSELPSEAEFPLEHCKRGVRDAHNLVLYFERVVPAAGGYRKSFERHADRLRAMALLSMAQTLERFFKELAAVCVNQLAEYVYDDRFSSFKLHARNVAAHFAERDLGKALVEGDTWLDSGEINKRFKRLLAMPYEDGNFNLYPPSKTDSDFHRRGTLDILWQIRHSMTHNAGVLTLSDATKLHRLCGPQNKSDTAKGNTVLNPATKDVWYVKQFIEDLAAWCNNRVAVRLAEVFTRLHIDNDKLFDPLAKAKELATIMQVDITIAGDQASPPVA